MAKVLYFHEKKSITFWQPTKNTPPLVTIACITVKNPNREKKALTAIPIAIGTKKAPRTLRTRKTD